MTCHGAWRTHRPAEGGVSGLLAPGQRRAAQRSAPSGLCQPQLKSPAGAMPAAAAAAAARDSSSASSRDPRACCCGGRTKRGGSDSDGRPCCSCLWRGGNGHLQWQRSSRGDGRGPGGPSARHGHGHAPDADRRGELIRGNVPHCSLQLDPVRKSHLASSQAHVDCRRCSGTYAALHLCTWLRRGVDAAQCLMMRLHAQLLGC